MFLDVATLIAGVWAITWGGLLGLAQIRQPGPHSFDIMLKGALISITGAFIIALRFPPHG